MNRIFTITPGRSGIHFLSAIFDNCCDTGPTGMYEPFEIEVLTTYQKRLLVDKVWGDLPETYVSTSLYPKNGYIKLLAEKGARFIGLKRDIRDNAMSWYIMDGIPYRTSRGLVYHPKPTYMRNCIQVESCNKLSDYQLCLWLKLEVDRRIEYARDYLKADVFEVNTEDLNKPDFVKELLDWSRLDYDLSKLKDVYSEPGHKNKSSSMPDDIKRSDVDKKECLIDRIDHEYELNTLMGYLNYNKYEEVNV